MANTLLNRAWAVPSTELDGTEKAVLVNLCDRSNDEGDNLRASTGAIAAETCLHRVTVLHALQRLVEKGFIVKLSGRVRGAVQHYRLNLTALKWERFKGKAVTEGNRSDEAKTSQPVADNNTATQTVSEPCTEPKERTTTLGRSKFPGHQKHAQCGERICLTAFQLEQFINDAGDDAESRPYERTATVDQKRELFDRIRIVHEEIDPALSAQAREWLLEANTIGFVGFGFHPINCDRLRLNEPLPNSTVWATAKRRTH